MATRKYGVSRGENIDQVTESVGAAVGADSIELTYDLAVGLTKEDVMLGLEKIGAFIMKTQFPPA